MIGASLARRGAAAIVEFESEFAESYQHIVDLGFPDGDLKLATIIAWSLDTNLSQPLRTGRIPKTGRLMVTPQ